MKYNSIFLTGGSSLVPAVRAIFHRRFDSDRIESGTYAIAAAMSGGDVFIEDAPVTVMDALLAKLKTTGAMLPDPETPE